MFIAVQKRLTIETYYFRKLSLKARNLVVSYILQGAAYPLIGTFVNAYIWRTQGNIISVAAYNIGNFISLPIFFYLNGVLLKRFKLSILYLIGASLSASAAVFVVYFKSFNPVNYLFYGLMYGVGFGLYWANRNYLTFKETESENRNYFIGLNFSIDTLTGIVIPGVTGWLLVVGQNLGLYNIESSYKVMIIIAFVLNFLSGFIVYKDQYEGPVIDKIFHKHA